MTAAPKPQPKPKVDLDSYESLLDQVIDLRRELTEACKEREDIRNRKNQYARALTALTEQYENLKRRQHMATATATAPKVEAKAALGDILQYQPPDPAASPVVALVMAVHDDGTFDVKAFAGYCLGTTDVAKVMFSDDAETGKVSKLGAKPKEPETPKEPPKEAPKQHKGSGETH